MQLVHCGTFFLVCFISISKTTQFHWNLVLSQDYLSYKFVSYPYFAWSWFVNTYWYIIIKKRKVTFDCTKILNFCVYIYIYMCVCVCVCVYIYIWRNLRVYNLCQYRALSVSFIHFQNINLYLPWKTSELCRFKKKKLQNAYPMHYCNYMHPSFTCFTYPWSVLFNTQVIFVHAGIVFSKFSHTASVAQFQRMSCPI